MDEKRFERLEVKVDELKNDFSEHRLESRLHMEITNKHFEELSKEMRHHIAGDKKIINKLTPVMPHLIEMSEDYLYNLKKKREMEEKRTKKTTMLKAWSAKIAIALGIISLIGYFSGALKFLNN